MLEPLFSIRDLVARIARNVDSLAASGSIANARSAARETSLQVAFRSNVPDLPQETKELASQSA